MSQICCWLMVILSSILKSRTSRNNSNINKNNTCARVVLEVYLSACVRIRQSTCMCLIVCLSQCLPVSVSVFMSVQMSVFLSTETDLRRCLHKGVLRHFVVAVVFVHDDDLVLLLLCLFCLTLFLVCFRFSPSPPTPPPQFVDLVGFFGQAVFFLSSFVSFFSFNLFFLSSPSFFLSFFFLSFIISYYRCSCCSRPQRFWTRSRLLCASKEKVGPCSHCGIRWKSACKQR